MRRYSTPPPNSLDFKDQYLEISTSLPKDADNIIQTPFSDQRQQHRIHQTVYPPRSSELQQSFFDNPNPFYFCSADQILSTIDLLRSKVCQAVRVNGH
ncbi:hypothetical protein L2E82_33514 [Cichorium intybus]|uniref:Uncharacterized protein n=1 Tax=Cichorium intybus TaxID=13427 RepID=A0ACB9BKC9_CICIN|nr:hypothetical protein L2E82_33514 [Cichorium intybus]